MATKSLEIKSKSVQTTAAYESEVYRAEINFSQNQDNELDNVNMTVYKKSNSSYVGNVNANKGGEGSQLNYSINGVPQSQLTDVTAFVNDVADSINEYASTNATSL